MINNKTKVIQAKMNQSQPQTFLKVNEFDFPAAYHDDEEDEFTEVKVKHKNKMP